MKKILACICAVSILFGAIFFTAGNVFAFTVVDDADEAVGFQIKAPFYPQYSTPMWKTK